MVLYLRRANSVGGVEVGDWIDVEGGGHEVSRTGVCERNLLDGDGAVGKGLDGARGTEGWCTRAVYLYWLYPLLLDREEIR